MKFICCWLLAMLEYNYLEAYWETCKETDAFYNLFFGDPKN